MQCNIGGRYIKLCASSRLSILQYMRQCTIETCARYFIIMNLQCYLCLQFSFKVKVITNELNIRMCLSRNFLFSGGGRNFYSKTGGEYRNGKW